MTNRFHALLLTIVLLSSGGTAAPSTDTWEFVQLADPQLGMTDYRNNIGSLEQAVKQINLLNPAFVILCGDLVHKPNPQSILDFQKIIASFTVPVHCLPGNHDLTLVHPNDALTQWRRLFGRDYDSFRAPPFRVIMINTLLFKNPLTNETAAEVSWLTNELRSAVSAGDIPLIAGHHPLYTHDPGEPDGWQNIPRESRVPLLTWFHEYGVRAMLTGHTHAAFTNTLDGMIMLSAEATSTNMDGHALGFRLWRVSGGQLHLPVFIPLYMSTPPAEDHPAAASADTPCDANLHLIDAAKELMGMREGLTNGASIDPTKLTSIIPGGLESLHCPDNGHYTINPLGVDPACSADHHALPHCRRYDEFSKRAAAQQELRRHLLP